MIISLRCGYKSTMKRFAYLVISGSLDHAEVSHLKIKQLYYKGKPHSAFCCANNLQTKSPESPFGLIWLCENNIGLFKFSFVPEKSLRFEVEFCVTEFQWVCAINRCFPFAPY